MATMTVDRDDQMALIETVAKAPEPECSECPVPYCPSQYGEEVRSADECRAALLKHFNLQEATDAPTP